MSKLVKDSSLMFLSTLLSALFQFGVGIYLSNKLGPLKYGIWLTISLIFIYGQLLHFGVINAINREIPQEFGRGNFSRVREIRSVALTWMFVPCSLSVIALIIICFINLEQTIKIYFALAILIVPIQQLMSFYRILFLTVDDFKQVSINQLLIGPIQQMLILLFVIVFDFYGLFIGIYVSSFIAIIILYNRLPEKVGLCWNWKLVKYLISFGAPILIIGLSWNLFTTLDRIMISSMLGAKFLGYYGISIFVFQGLMMFPQVISQVLYPKIGYKFGKDGLNGGLIQSINNVSTILSLSTPYLLAIIYYLLPYFVKYFMPKYNEGIESATIIAIGLFPLVIISVYTVYLNSSHKHKKYLSYLFIGILTNSFLNFLFIKFKFEIVGVSFATSISNLIYSFLIINFCLNDFNFSFKKKVGQLFLNYCPFITLVIIIVFMKTFNLNNIFSLLFWIILYTCVLIFFLRLRKIKLIKMFKETF
ncbi:hypothetical protein E2K98_04515 [Bacillus salipaludis]|uniref:Uncharacterized protein n=1 Tax=Bacillus salipaludis TaxID=2547811 RepID=A0A4R5VY32_9BACI|nr:oligosaccharide flippase family protein [Bacillus salipaludis]TDK64133.1 hypothetical protein E2K98_04515 [Bacillus salipaludis]